MNGMANDDQFYYFAYASNLKVSLLAQRTGDTLHNYLQGRLPDYGFRFNRRNTDGSARANIIESESEDVFGAVYQIDQKYRDLLLNSEPGYSIINVSVETEQGNIEAFTFISGEDQEDIYPAKEYLDSILEGAREHSLPEEYVDFIRSMAK